MTRIMALVWPELRASDADATSWKPMLDALDDLSPRVEAVDLGVALVDVTGLGPLWGPERRIAARAVALVRAVAPLRVRCGVGGNRWLATLAARLARFERPDAPAAFHVLEADELRDLSLDLLPADAATRARISRFGLTTMGQLAELPRSAVGAQFGAPGDRLQALARGHDPRPIVPRRRPERVARRATFEPPLSGTGAVGLALRRLAAELCDELRARPLAPGRATLSLDLEDAPPLRVIQAFPQPALEPDWIARLLLSRLEAAARARSCRGAGPSARSDPKVAGGPAAGQPDESAEAPARPRGKLPSSTVVAAPRPIEPISALKQAKNPRKSKTSTGPESLKDNPVVPWQLRAEEAEDEPGIASVTLAFDRLIDPAMTQLPAFEARSARWEELRWSFERIRHRFGDGRLWRATVDRPAAALAEHRSRLTDIGA
jgi:nucleotidyltransferase/DNA polymerase involved in DNA repair